MSTDCPTCRKVAAILEAALDESKRFDREYAALKIKHEQDRIELMKKLGITEEDVVRWKAGAA